MWGGGKFVPVPLVYYEARMRLPASSQLRWRYLYELPSWNLTCYCFNQL